MGMLKMAASFVLGLSSCSRTNVYAPRAQSPAALLDDHFEHSLLPFTLYIGSGQKGGE